MNAEQLYIAFTKNNGGKLLKPGNQTVDDLLQKPTDHDYTFEYTPKNSLVRDLGGGRFKIRALPSSGPAELIPLAFGDCVGDDGYGNTTICYEVAGEGDVEFESLQLGSTSFVYTISATALIITPKSSPVVIFSSYRDRAISRIISQRIMFSPS